jgi:maltose alpha-D-glucosyltransferase/alpha-amylase
MGKNGGRVSGPRERQSTGFPSDPQWYKDAVIYELHVRAFQDSSGDGIGDFRGLTSRLDYLADLGVTTIWLLPFYPSPGRDDGYDIADYGSVNPDYGTLRDVRALIREAHRRDLRVITELVFNHTSDQHPWFQRARKAAPGSVERNWYVWSDTPDRYGDARIIFKDFEASNWSWDAVAGAYFWHRFYSHQPDLNFDEPRVQEALFKATDFWLEAGVDGLRLDAIPYLYERDGTNGENLPETHAFLKSLRRHVDERFADRMLLAEANQWPEDSVAYFGDGDGDECHMAFHFPLMPRMFMALRMEDRFPILDILEQTPDLPKTSQWALFLRNHDELTLEMVTDEERDYMYRVYAADPQARINLGIRRRLAPLLGNNRRRIELMNGLLFSLPGTPVIYYGDEIGMGDNVYVGDRNGVRTPMQWSSDRNAGFSAANRQRLYLPIITDPEYHYEAVNVETQQANPQSLLWWMKRVIALRKKHPAFGRGSLQFLHPDNRRILAFVREHEDETILVVANLSRYAQWTELPLADYEGRVPVELFGSGEFPRVGAEPYLISLGPHSFLWFRLATDPAVAELAPGATDLPELAWRGDLQDRLKRHSDEVADVLLRWMVTRRWYRGGTHAVAGADITEVVAIPSSPPAVVAFLQVQYRDTEPATYVLPLTTDEQFDAESMLADNPEAAVARLVGEGSVARLLDGSFVPGVFETLLGIVTGRRRIKGSQGDLVGHALKGLKTQLAGATAAQLTAAPIREQPTMSNSSAAYGDRLVLKLYRVLEDGPNPDQELGRFLADAGFANVPRVLGSAEMSHGPDAAATLAMVQAYVPHEGNLWQSTREAVGAYLHDVEAESEPPQLVPDGDRFFLKLSQLPLPDRAQSLLGASLQTARVLGERLGEMHVLLADADPGDPDFAPEPMSPFYVRSLYESVRRRVNNALELLEDRRDSLPLRDQAAARIVLEASPRVDALLRHLRDLHTDGQRIRVHGDLHLGQVLDTGNDVVIIDFEGDTARPLSQRRLKRPALTDLASLVRSFHFAAHWPRVERELLSEDVVEPEGLAPWSTYWFQWMSAACIAGYRGTTTDGAFNPSDDEAWSLLFKALLVSRACDELSSRLGERSDWLGIPLAGLDELLGGAGEPTA